MAVAGRGQIAGGLQSEVACPDNWCHTNFPRTHYSLAWTVDKLSLFPAPHPGPKITSATFSSIDNTANKWCLDLFENPSDPNYLSLHLRLVEAPQDLLTLFSFAILNERKEQQKTWPTTITRFTTRANSHGHDKWMQREVLLDEAMRLLCNDEFTILCQITVLTENTRMLRKGDLIRSPLPEYDLGSILESEEFSDVTFSVGDEEIRAHAAVLVARSSVFRRLLEPVGNNQYRVLAENVDPEDMRQFLRFIYTNTVEDISESAGRLLGMASRHELDGLKDLCEVALCQRLCVQNAVETLELASRYSASMLKQVTIKFLKESIKGRTEDAVFDSTSDTYEDTLVDLFNIVNGTTS